MWTAEKIFGNPPSTPYLCLMKQTDRKLAKKLVDRLGKLPTVKFDTDNEDLLRLEEELVAIRKKYLDLANTPILS